MLCLKDFELKRSENTAGVVSCAFIFWVALMACLYVLLVPSEDTRETIYRYALYSVIVFVIILAWIYFNIGLMHFLRCIWHDSYVFLFGLVIYVIISLVAIGIVLIAIAVYLR